jgi:hypothetical protein
MRISSVLAALSLSGALVLGSQMPVRAAPITALSAAAKPDSQFDRGAVQVRFVGGWRGGGWGGGWRGGGWRGGWGRGGWGWGVGGLAAGALIGAAIASQPWGDPYYAYDAYDAYPVGPVGFVGPACGPWGCGPGPYWRRPIGWRVGGWGWGPGWW